MRSVGKEGCEQFRERMMWVVWGKRASSSKGKEACE